MSCGLSDEELWSGIDRNAPDVVEHIDECPICRRRAAEFRAGIDAVTTTSAVAAAPLPKSIGPYSIQRRLGEGGMGIVYEGEQQSPKRLVAIKVVRRGQDASEFRTRLFQREAQTLARLRHPAIAAVYEAGRTEDGQEYFAMELVQGEPLNKYVQDREVPRSERLKLFRKICDAINYAHQRGVIHRDLKPTNILVDPEGNPKILDFGLARISDPDETITTLISDVGRMMGTLPYMSPEEARGDPDEIDVRSDVYSLGVILYELLTDKLPYTVTRTKLPEAVRVICEEMPQKPSAEDRILRGDLDTITLKALEKQAVRRYQSAGQLGEDVHRYLTDQPILARPASALYQFRKFLTRHRLYVTAAVASILVVSAARVYIDRLDTGRRTDIEQYERQLMLQAAIPELGLAERLHQDKEFNRAEPMYRRSLNTFTVLDDVDRSVEAMIGLAWLLIERTLGSGDPADNPSVEAENLYGEAESLLVDALDTVKANQAVWSLADRRALQRRALERLRTLYGPDAWNDAEFHRKTEAELEALDAMPPERDPLPVSK